MLFLLSHDVLVPLLYSDIVLENILSEISYTAYIRYKFRCLLNHRPSTNVLVGRIYFICISFKADVSSELTLFAQHHRCSARCHLVSSSVLSHAAGVSSAS